MTLLVTPPEPTLLGPAPPHSDPVALRLLDERVLVLGDLDDGAAERAITRLLLLAALDARADITVYVGTRQGSAGAGLAVHDTMVTLAPPLATRALGLVGPVGALLVASGTPGHRLALPHARLRLAPPSAGGPTGDRSGLGDGLRDDVVTQLAAHTGRSGAEMAELLATDRWCGAAEAVTLGLVDGMVESPSRTSPTGPDRPVGRY